MTTDNSQALINARLEEIESEWMRLSQEDGKAERAIERLTTKLDEQLRINGMGAEREYVLLEKVAQLELERDKLVSKVEYTDALLARMITGAGDYVLDTARESERLTSELTQQRKVLEQALEALNMPSLKTMAMLEQRDAAITAIQEILK